MLIKFSSYFCHGFFVDELSALQETSYKGSKVITILKCKEYLRCHPLARYVVRYGEGFHMLVCCMVRYGIGVFIRWYVTWCGL